MIPKYTVQVVAASQNLIHAWIGIYITPPPPHIVHMDTHTHTHTHTHTQTHTTHITTSHAHTTQTYTTAVMLTECILFVSDVGDYHKQGRSVYKGSSM